MPGAHTTAEEWRAHPAHAARPPVVLDDAERPIRRLVVVSAHPDDESLGAGGLIAAASDAGLDVYVVLLTAGEASPFAARGSSRHALARLRLAETENALQRLAPDNFLVFLGAPDGAVADAEEAIGRSLAGLIGDGGQTLLVAPWRQDPHDDHAAAGRAAAVAAAATGARLLEYPLLAWRLLRPDALPWDRVRRLDLDDALRARKAAAIRAHVSQVRAAHSEPPLPDRILEHFEGPCELFVQSPTCDEVEVTAADVAADSSDVGGEPQPAGLA